MCEKRLDRATFAGAVFARDAHTCVLCGRPAADAHHILDRKLFHDGGYYLSNGAAVCAPCHLEVEATSVSVEDVRSACRIVEPALPEGFSRDESYDKWGNRILSDGRREPGPLFLDDGCRKALQAKGLLWSGIFVLTYDGQ